ncbi:MAG: hypothetical protein VSS75_011460 [Candidatus Parabeggiatoa sp.]|nr:hypothetical protein [Candidatus Parabeggiatoa sp.]
MPRVSVFVSRRAIASKQWKQSLLLSTFDKLIDGKLTTPLLPICFL